MNIKILISFAFIFLFSIFLVELISAEIIWSRPTTVYFNVTDTHPNEQELIITIISPNDDICRSKNVPLQVKTNLNADCTYSLDKQPSIYLGNGTYFSKNLRVNNGEHIIVVTCKTQEQYKSKYVVFNVKLPRLSNQTSPLDDDLAYEEYLNTAVYSEWNCINNKLQREVTFGGITNTEIGQICGIVDEQSTQKKTFSFSLGSYYWILPILLLIFILLVLLLMFAVVRTNK